jgi:hypothetical protein
MSDFEAEEALEATRSALAGLLLRISPGAESAIMAFGEVFKAELHAFVEAKVLALAPNIVEQVEDQVKSILKTALADTAPVDNGDTFESIRDHMEQVNDMTDDLILEQFTLRAIRGAYTAEQISRFSVLFKVPELFRSEGE